MTFDLNKYQTLKQLHDEENAIGEDPETNDLLTPGNFFFRFSVKHWRDNLDNIIEND